jgi:hypothetical protein
MPKLINCIPNTNSWQGQENAKVQDQDPGKAANLAHNQSLANAKGLVLAFIAQDCTPPPPCSWKDPLDPVYTDGNITIVPNQPPDAAHRGQKGPFWEATAPINWSISVNCYPNKKARDDAHDAREAAKKKAKEDAEKK